MKSSHSKINEDSENEDKSLASENNYEKSPISNGDFQISNRNLSIKKSKFSQIKEFLINNNNISRRISPKNKSFKDFYSENSN